MNRIKTLKHHFLLLVAFFIFSTIQAETKDKQIKVALRTIGHEFLLQLNDSTSRILPIEKVNGRYAIKFERNFSFEPDFLSVPTYKVLEASGISGSFIVEVEACNTPKVVHSFEANLNKKENSMGCRKRGLPADCYVFYFTLLDNEKQEAIVKENRIAFVEEKPKAVIEEKLEAVDEEKPKADAKSAGWNAWIFPLILAVMGGGAFLFIKRKPRPKNAELMSIGKFQFDKKRMRLNLRTQSIELSSIETDLLYLLNTNENKTLERKYILNVIWCDQRDYVGRTLDVFISKLRKKLEADPNVKIINIRGVGYRLVISS